MSLIDFEYAGEKLSEHSCIIAHVTDDGDAKAVSVGNTLTFNTVRNNNSFVEKIISAKYESAYSITFQICKNPCLDETFELSDMEVRSIMQWLNKKDFNYFYPIYDDGSYYDVRYKGSFNVSPITYYGKVIGMELVFRSNAPYGFGLDNYYELEITEDDIANGTNSIYIEGDSDETGYVYMNTIIECHAEGKLIIQNSADNRITSIDGCKAGETIIINGENKIIESNMEHEGLYNDFNYAYPRIFSRHDGDHTSLGIENTYTISLPCFISMTYIPIRKAGIVL